MEKRNKYIQKLSSTLQGFTGTVRRFPITVLFFLLSAVLTSYYISEGFSNNYFELLFSFIIGAALFMVLQLYFERFIKANSFRLIFGGLAVFGALVYYLVLKFVVDEMGTDIVVRTTVLLFILLILFIWIPSIKSKIGFSDSFMAIFKGFFTVVFYSGVMFLGIALILMATDLLIADIDGKVYGHFLNIIAFVYAPLHFLSLIPVYPAFYANESQDTLNNNTNLSEENAYQKLKKAIEPSKFLEGLISYIIIPVTVVFTLILLLYIILNITGDFWKDNLLESLLVTYSITVITVYLLASVIKNKISAYFRTIFPKVLIPVVLFQTISSVLKIGELGITAGRYYVILFGIFATVSAVIFSLKPNSKTNIIAPVLIVLALVSIFPPTDAFAISRKNQINRLTEVLKENDMLKDGKVIPNENISRDDKQIIVNAIQYLNRMNYTKDITWLKDYSRTRDFEGTFGFSQYDMDVKVTEIYSFYLPKGLPLDISGYDYFVEAEFYGDNQQISYEVGLGENNEYILTYENKGSLGELLLKDSQNKELIRYSLKEIYDTFKERKDSAGEITLDEAKFISGNENAMLCLIVKNANFEFWEDRSYHSIETFIMIRIK